MARSYVERDWSTDGESVADAESAAIEHHVDDAHPVERRSDRADGEITVGSDDADRARSN